MFGHVTANLDRLNQEEKDRYRQVYCGLCHALDQRYGHFAKGCLTYDMTFLILLLSSLYEPEESGGNRRCVVHPVRMHSYTQNAITAYAADMSIALTYHKCLDDWKDEHKILERSYASILKNAYTKVENQWPRQCLAIKDNLARLEAIEQIWGKADDAANWFGALMGELFVWRQDAWEQTLHQFGACLGRFIYAMDAVVDYEADKKNNTYNPLLVLGKTPEQMKEPLLLLIGQAAELFEKLPLIQDERLLRNILYGGVWQKYNTMLKRTRKDNKDGTESV